MLLVHAGGLSEVELLTKDLGAGVTVVRVLVVVLAVGSLEVLDWLVDCGGGLDEGRRASSAVYHGLLLEKNTSVN